MATTKQNQMIAGRMVEFQDRFSFLRNDDAQWLIQNAGEGIDLFMKAIIYHRKTNAQIEILRLIPGGHTFLLNALSGEHLIYQAKETFSSFISKEFLIWSFNKTGIATPETYVQVREMTGGETVWDMFEALPGDWNHRWVSQNQVIEFCENLSPWLSAARYGTFFLIKKDENKIINENDPSQNSVVVFVNVKSDGLGVNVISLGAYDIRDGHHNPRVVSPALWI
jgi:hypothetical protein